MKKESIIEKIEELQRAVARIEAKYRDAEKQNESSLDVLRKILNRFDLIIERMDKSIKLQTNIADNTWYLKVFDSTITEIAEKLNSALTLLQDTKNK